MRRALIFKICFGLLVATATGQPVRIAVEHLTPRQGLAENKVLQVLRDHDGLYWFSTGLELNRYDGRRFHVFPLIANNAAMVKGSGTFYGFHFLSEQTGRMVTPLEVRDIRNLGVFDPANGAFSVRPLTGLAEKERCTGLFADDKERIYALFQAGNQLFLNRYGPHFQVEKRIAIGTTSAFGKFDDVVNSLYFALLSDKAWYCDAQNGIVETSCEDAGKRVWSRYWHDGAEKPMPLGKENAFLIADVQKHLWAVFPQAKLLIRFYPEFGQWRQVAELPIIATSAVADRSGNLIVYDDKNTGNRAHSIWLYQAEQERLTNVSSIWQEGQLYSVGGADFSQSIFLCTSAGIWKGALSTSGIQAYLKNQTSPNNTLRGLAECRNGDLVLTFDNHPGLYRLRKNSGEQVEKMALHDRRNSPVPAFGYPGRLQTDAHGNVWGLTRIPTYRLFRLESETNTCDFFEIEAGAGDFAVSADGKGVWVGGIGRLYRLDVQTNRIQQVLSEQTYPELRNRHVTYICPSRNGKQVWIGTSNGFFCFDPVGNKLLEKPGPDDPLRHFPVFCIHENADGTLWIGTGGGGLFLYHPATGHYEQFDQNRGLANNKVAGILPGDNGDIWVSTFFGLSYFNRQTQAFINFFEEDGLTHNEFNRWSFLKDSDGRLHFGSLNGVTAFRPADLLRPRQREPRKVLPVEFQWGGKTVLTGLTQLHEVVIPAETRSCSFTFALNDFHKPLANRYTYRMEGLDKNWTYIGSNGMFAFAWLPAGEYRLRVKAADAVGQWSDEYTLPVRVRAYFYKTWWFAVSVLLATGLLAWLLYRKFLAERLEIVRLKSLDELKSNLYADITHEFRTPLTLILGNAEKAIRLTGDAKTGLHGNLKQIRYAGQRLLQLVNQILDLRKLEAGKLRLHWQQGDVVKMLRLVTENFRSLAENKGLELHFISTSDAFFMDFDSDALQKIVDNLLSNAVKFTPPGGKVIVSATQAGEQLVVQVQDTGVGIPPDQLHLVFNRFYQVDAHLANRRFQKAQPQPPEVSSGASADARQEQGQVGTGLGLTLVKELVQLLGGAVRVESQPGERTTFRVFLPIRRTAPIATGDRGNMAATAYFEAETEAAALPPNAVRDVAEQPQVLLVEDNPEIARFIADCLSDFTQIIFAQNGRIGCEKAFEWVPDLILTDVMMPEMDGFSLLENVKNDPRTSHIPVVMLTARAEAEDRISGLRRGANAYLTKPFLEEELRLTVRNLLRSNDRLVGRYQASLRETPINLTPVAAPDPDAAIDLALEDAFFKNVVAYVEKRLDDTGLSVDDLCRHVGMSQSQLHRKLTALCGASANRLIRAVRLSHARSLLLQNPAMTISEIAYLTGFTALSYFTRVFTSETGLSPSEWREQQSS